MSLGAVFHGAQLMLDLAVAGLSLMVALGLFAVLTTVLCAAAFLYHSKPIASNENTVGGNAVSHIIFPAEGAPSAAAFRQLL